jgi:hypothetical protein
VEDWALIRHLHRSEMLSQRAIARQLGVARGTVTAALASEGPPTYQRAAVESAISPAEPRIRALLSVCPQMPATVIAERIGWSGSMSWFRERVAVIRPEYAPADPADRLEHRPGRVVQCDLWFPPAEIALGFDQSGSPPVLVMVAAFSRFITALMLPSRQTMDLVAGMWSLLSGQIGAVPHELWWDNEAGIERRGRLTDPVTSFVGTPRRSGVQTIRLHVSRWPSLAVLDQMPNPQARDRCSHRMDSRPRRAGRRTSDRCARLTGKPCLLRDGDLRTRSGQPPRAAPAAMPTRNEPLAARRSPRSPVGQYPVGQPTAHRRYRVPRAHRAPLSPPCMEGPGRCFARRRCAAGDPVGPRGETLLRHVGGQRFDDAAHGGRVRLGFGFFAGGVGANRVRPAG